MVLQSGFSFEKTDHNFVIENGELIDIGTLKDLLALESELDKETTRQRNKLLSGDLTVLDEQVEDVVNRVLPPRRNPETIINGSDLRFFLKVLSVDADDDQQIVDFYNEYGPLAGQRLDADHSITWHKNEPLDVARRGFKYFRAVFDLSNALVNSDMDRIVPSLRVLLDLYVSNPTPEHYRTNETIIQRYLTNPSEFWPSEVKEILKLRLQRDQNKTTRLAIRFSEKLVEALINAHINNIRPNLSIADTKPHGRWIANIPLSAIYFEYFLALNERAIFRKCANTTCNQYFEIYGSDKRKIFHDHTCANTVAVRRKRSKSLKAGELNGNDHEAR